MFCDSSQFEAMLWIKADGKWNLHRRQDDFEHLLAEIREIRLSKRRFYQKLTDIYATAVDYNRDAPTTRLFYKKVQNNFTLPFTATPPQN